MENDNKKQGTVQQENKKKPVSTDISELTINKQTMDLLAANVIPTTKYFESHFDYMQYQIDEVKKNLL